MSAPLLQRCAICGDNWWDAHVCPLKQKVAVVIPGTMGPAMEQMDADFTRHGYMLQVASDLERCPHCMQLAPSWSREDLIHGWRMDGPLMKHYHCREAAAGD
jgi:hypothetical protein